MSYGRHVVREQSALFTTESVPLMNVKPMGALGRRQALLLSAATAATLMASAALAQGPSNPASYP
jgi:hypothetical protein